jgi:hypothetical protein
MGSSSNSLTQSNFDCLWKNNHKTLPQPFREWILKGLKALTEWPFFFTKYFRCFWPKAKPCSVFALHGTQKEENIWVWLHSRKHIWLSLHDHYLQAQHNENGKYMVCSYTAQNFWCERTHMFMHIKRLIQYRPTNICWMTM